LGNVNLDKFDPINRLITLSVIPLITPNVCLLFFQCYLLSLFEVFLESVGEPLGVLDELALALLQGLLAGDARDVGRDVVHRVQQLLDGARNVPGENKIIRKIEFLVIEVSG
jgi:hypothetical protein